MVVTARYAPWAESHLGAKVSDNQHSMDCEHRHRCESQPGFTARTLYQGRTKHVNFIFASQAGRFHRKTRIS